MDLNNKKLKVEFAPGCFDNFEGTQEELDEFIAEIQKIMSDPELLQAKSRPIDVDELDEEDLAKLAPYLFNDEELAELERMGMPSQGKKTLQ